MRFGPCLAKVGDNRRQRSIYARPSQHHPISPVIKSDRNIFYILLHIILCDKIQSLFIVGVLNNGYYIDFLMDFSGIILPSVRLYNIIPALYLASWQRFFHKLLSNRLFIRRSPNTEYKFWNLDTHMCCRIYLNIN